MELVDPPLREPLQANPVASATDMRLALMTFVLEPINLASALEEKLEVTDLLKKNLSTFYLFYLGQRWVQDLRPVQFPLPS